MCMMIMMRVPMDLVMLLLSISLLTCHGFTPSRYSRNHLYSASHQQRHDHDHNDAPPVQVHVTIHGGAVQNSHLLLQAHDYDYDPINSDSHSFLRFSASFQYSSKPIRISHPSDTSLSLLSDTLYEFFQKDIYRNSIFVGSGNMNAKEQTISKDDDDDDGSAILLFLNRLHVRWKEELSYFMKHKWVDFVDPTFPFGQEIEEDKKSNSTSVSSASTRSVSSSSIVELRVRTSFLVFTIHAIATLGAQLLQRDIASTEMGNQTKVPRKKQDEDDLKLESRNNYTHGPSVLRVHLSFPEYQFVLLDEDFEAEGPPPLIWIFNQLTGKGTRKRPSLQSTQQLEGQHLLHAFINVYPSVCLRRDDGSLVGALEDGDDDDGDDGDDGDGDGQFNQMEVKFHASSKAEINISFPAVLLRILPVPKEIIERQGNLALSQNMERDVVPGIDKFRSAFIEYYKRRNLHRNK